MRRDLLKTLFSRMLTTYLTVTLGLIVILGVTVVTLLHGQNMRARQIEQQQELRSIGAVETAVVQGQLTREAADLELAVIARHYDGLIDIYAVDGTGSHYYQAEKWRTLAGRALSQGELERLIAYIASGQKQTTGYFHGVSDLPVLTSCALLTQNNVATHVVLFHTDISDVKEDTRSVAVEIGLIAVVGLLVAIIAVYYTTTAFTKPFMEVNEIVQQYSKGDYNARIPISDTEEATQLALSFNAMADQLKDLEATRRSFVANVSHELRSPLTSMRGFLEAMQDGTIGPDEYEKNIDIVLSETRRMTSMVNDLLDLARIESGKTAIKLEIFDINELIRRTLITFEARISERRMDVDIKFAQEQCYVEADPAQISQVLRNLIDNAIKYSPEDRKLRIATYALKREVYVSIQDFGQGIPTEDIPHVFDRFYKVEKAHTPSKQSGTGLGLSIVKRIIDQHGQRITLKSTKGKGSTFTFTLKRAPSPKRQQQQDGGRQRYGIQ